MLLESNLRVCQAPDGFLKLPHGSKKREKISNFYVATKKKVKTVFWLFLIFVKIKIKNFKKGSVEK